MTPMNRLLWIVAWTTSVLSVSTTAYAQSTLWSNAGSTIGEWFGVSFAVVADVNSDGHNEIVAGGAGFPPHFPTASRSVARLISGDDGSTLYTWQADNTSDFFGCDVASGGDVDDDGTEDIVVGAGTLSDGKYAKVFSGADGSTLYTIGPLAGSDSAGCMAVGLADINADGNADIIVGHRSGASINKGRVRVFSGSDGTTVLFDAQGTNDHDEFGLQVAGIEDVNDDGHDDIVIKRGKANYPQIHVYSGDTGTLLYTIDQETNAGFTYEGIWTKRFEVVGDIDGDGIEDLVVNEGTVLRGFSSSDGAQVFRIARTLQNQLHQVAQTQDVTGDAVPDLLVLSQIVSSSDFRLDLLSGADGSLFGTYHMYPSFSQWQRMISPGDLDNDADGTWDVVIGNPYDDTTTTDSGLVFGNSIPPNPVPCPTEHLIQNVTFLQDQVEAFNASEDIEAGSYVDAGETSGPVVVESGADVTLRAQDYVHLAPGFEVESGGVLRAFTDSNVCAN